MMCHNIHFKGVIWKIIPKLSLYPSLSGALSKVPYWLPLLKTRLLTLSLPEMKVADFANSIDFDEVAHS